MCGQLLLLALDKHCVEENKATRSLVRLVTYLPMASETSSNVACPAFTQGMVWIPIFVLDFSGSDESLW